MTNALLILHEKCNKPAAEPEWVAWHREEHEPDILATGAEHVTFWQLLAQARARDARSRLLARDHRRVPDDHVPDLAGALAELRAAGRIHANHTVIDAGSYVVHGKWNDKPAPTDALRGHILAHVMANDPTREAEWDEWYDREHIPDMMTSDAFSTATQIGGANRAVHSGPTSSRSTT